MKSHRVRVTSAASLLLLTGNVLAGNYSFLENTPISQFNDADVALMRQAAGEVLESEDLSASKEWRNEATSNSGRMYVMGAFKAADGRYCKVLQVTNRAGSLESRTRYPVCKAADGQWMIDADAKPAAKPAT